MQARKLFEVLSCLIMRTATSESSQETAGLTLAYQKESFKTNETREIDLPVTALYILIETLGKSNFHISMNLG